MHAGAAAVGRAEAGKGKPGFVPQKDQVRFDGKAFLHHAFDVVPDPVEGAVGEQQHAHPVELAGCLEFQQAVLDLPERHSAVHRVVVERVAVQIDDLRARQHHAVVMGFVAVAVHQHDVAGANDGLHHDLVAGRGAVGGKEGLLGAEGRAAFSWAFLMGPCGSSRLSSPPEVAEVSARKMFMP